MRLFFFFLILALAGAVHTAPVSFERAKIEARQNVYYDRTEVGTLYCGCQWQWAGRSGGRVDLQSCGYQVRSQDTRAARIEWEHIMPASNFGRARQCWQNGGRRNCTSNDPVFSAMEADLHNLAPSVGEVNADRSNYLYGVLPGATHQHGQCDFRVDFRQRTVEPRDAIKGKVARVYFYMHDHYDLPISRQQERLLMAWDKQFPVTPWELERDQRIAAVMGHHNPFVTGESRWRPGHRNSGAGVMSEIPTGHPALNDPGPGAVIRGNRNSRIYHLPVGCPSYDAMAARNIIEFSTASEAEAAGFRKAGNCR